MQNYLLLFGCLKRNAYKTNQKIVLHVCELFLTVGSFSHSHLNNLNVEGNKPVFGRFRIIRGEVNVIISSQDSAKYVDV